ncbi:MULTISPECIES: DUF2637 domain-containing protein [unclassified Rhodococcus (in: high G+C Gram-positive bacteria)]|uniref:DUF2637 domain-containing protein n=1 Tax=unclassified Rhodococcus (in: high G+C Gram-positive bacteria) TaxID=192944 RepID=UPI0011EE2B42|nr:MULTISPECIES: DUF2637 domain-containing protein [unclassified Rhodococcus (in: high G+C Gram-positive bacteria)]KAA0925044.1 DUF2637 domain-containing protein [Rhodococcus sp. ANT_H53B]MDI9927863.1 DUF2637 domain-containing protein [Rhodococcus sp. IEGM 1341]MDV8055792.1 DUF2637 domain-containing protein [Rhodococcus sp. IEGM 1343]
MNKVLRATLVSAVVITTVIGIASFVLSFAALWDLATMAGVPRSLSWLWPVIVDGTILQATISVIALAQFEDQRSGRRFFWGVLITAALVSIGANAMHAFISDAGTLHPALSAAIATVAPVSLLAATHGLGILVRVPAELPKTIDIADEEPAVEEVAIVPRTEPVTPAAELTTPDIPAPAPIERTEPVRTEPVLTEPVRSEHRPPESSVTSVRTVEPLDEVDRWILDEERVDDLYPVDAP